MHSHERLPVITLLLLLDIITIAITSAKKSAKVVFASARFLARLLEIYEEIWMTFVMRWNVPKKKSIRLFLIKLIYQTIFAYFSTLNME